MSDSILYQPSALAKRKIYPGVIILHTPSGNQINFNKPIEVKFFSGENGEWEELEDENYTDKIKFTYGSSIKKNSLKKINVGEEKMLYVDFINTITSNDPGSEFKSFVIIQSQGDLKKPEFSKIKAMELTFTMTDATTITTDKILIIQGIRNTKKAETLEQHFQKVADILYSTMKNNTAVDFTNLVESLPHYNVSRIVGIKKSRVEYYREHNNKTNFEPIQMISPRYMFVEENALFFVLLEKHANRKMSDYTIEHFNINPYDCGFNITQANEIVFENLFMANEGLYKGHKFIDYYRNVTIPSDKYIVVPFDIYDIQEASVVSKLTLTLQLPFNTILRTDLIITRDVRPSIVELERLRFNIGSVGDPIEIDHGDFSHIENMENLEEAEYHGADNEDNMSFGSLELDMGPLEKASHDGDDLVLEDDDVLGELGQDMSLDTLLQDDQQQQPDQGNNNMVMGNLDLGQVNMSLGSHEDPKMNDEDVLGDLGQDMSLFTLPQDDQQQQQPGQGNNNTSLRSHEDPNMNDEDVLGEFGQDMSLDIPLQEDNQQPDPGNQSNQDDNASVESLNLDFLNNLNDTGQGQFSMASDDIFSNIPTQQIQQTNNDRYDAWGNKIEGNEYTSDYDDEDVL